MTEYRRGAVLNGWPSRWPLAGAQRKAKRGIIRSMSARSMIRAGFQISNSPADFDCMTVLSFRERHPDAKKCLREWCLAMQLNNPTSTPWGWATEFQTRGMVHYHIIHTTAHLRVSHPHLGLRWQTVQRRGRPQSVLRGRLGDIMANLWIRIVGDSSEEFLRFQRGGICTKMDKPELTGAYLGGYIGKLAQKSLPDWEPPQGRWWWLSPAARPVAGVTRKVVEYPLARIHHLLHDKSVLDGKLGDEVARSIDVIDSANPAAGRHDERTLSQEGK